MAELGLYIYIQDPRAVWASASRNSGPIGDHEEAAADDFLFMKSEPCAAGTIGQSVLEIGACCGEYGRHVVSRESHLHQHCGTMTQKIVQIVERSNAQEKFVYIATLRLHVGALLVSLFLDCLPECDQVAIGRKHQEFALAVAFVGGAVDVAFWQSVEFEF